MILEKSRTKVPLGEFKEMAYYFGIAIAPTGSIEASKEIPSLQYKDIEIFFLSATYNLKTSRLAEGFLCWLLQFGHLLSPSKIRRLVQTGHPYDSAMLGGFTEFLIEYNIMSLQWKILKPFCKKQKKTKSLLEGPASRRQATYFIKYGIVAPQFQLDLSKFLLPTNVVFKNCMELKNRALFGSVVNADVVSYLKKHPGSTAYHTAKITHHHKARVFEVYPDILAAI